MSSTRRAVARLLNGDDLPPVTLLRSPPNVGTWALTLQIADRYSIGAIDRFIIADQLSTSAARAAVRFAEVAPFGKRRLIVLNLNGASPNAVNVLLKLCEEPPAAVRIILVSTDGKVADTLASRCQVVRLGLLTDERVRQTLVEQGMSAAQAMRYAGRSRGEILDPQQRKDQNRHRMIVIDLMRAIAEHNREAFLAVLGEWQDPCRDLLFRWLVEALTLEWSLFDEPDTFNLHHRPHLLRHMLLRLGEVPSPQSRLGIRVALEPFLAT